MLGWFVTPDDVCLTPFLHDPGLQPIAAVAMAVCDLFTISKENLLFALDGYVKVQVS